MPAATSAASASATSRVLAAPGERIMSTLPDHFYGGDGNKNDWGATSGTSMAAPYVAGASVLVREAMQNLGFTQITQGTIYDLFRRTADTIYDAATNASYSALNLDAGAGNARRRRRLRLRGRGRVARSARCSRRCRSAARSAALSDQDFFQFTAARTGKATLTLSDPQHLAAAWKQLGQGRVEGNKLTLDVVAGQTYVVGVAGGGTSIGKYPVDLRLHGCAAQPQLPAQCRSSATVATITGTSGKRHVRMARRRRQLHRRQRRELLAAPASTTVRDPRRRRERFADARWDERRGNSRAAPGSVEFAGGGMRISRRMQVEQIRVHRRRGSTGRRSTIRAATTCWKRRRVGPLERRAAS